MSLPHEMGESVGGYVIRAVLASATILESRSVFSTILHHLGSRRRLILIIFEVYTGEVDPAQRRLPTDRTWSTVPTKGRGSTVGLQQNERIGRRTVVKTWKVVREVKASECKELPNTHSHFSTVPSQ